jgi:hypothetical protein
MTRFCTVLVATLLLWTNALYAGKLKDIDTFDNSSTTSSSSSSGSATDILAENIIDVFVGALFAQRTAPQGAAADPLGGSENRGNLQGATIQEVNANLRKGYSFALPNIRLDGNYFYDPDGVHAFRVKGEGGYLMIAVDVDYTRFYEGKDRLNNLATHGLIRIPLSTEFAQMDVALGYRRLWGSQVHQGFDLGVPFYLNFGRWVQMDLKYYVTILGSQSPLQEIDAGIAGKYKWIGARVGYRHIKASGVSALRGPEAGLFFQW